VTLPANIINYEVIPSGGIVSLLFESSDIHGTWTITREGNGQTITLYQGPPMGTTNGTAYKWLYLDLGDGTNLPLNALQPYTYTFASTNAPSGVEVITPACSLVISQDGYLAIFMRCLQAGCNNIQSDCDAFDWCAYNAAYHGCASSTTAEKRTNWPYR
jgi:hypothetical protein